MPLTKVQSRGTENVGQGSSNLIINGAMTISQRGSSFASANGYTLDRYGYYRSGGGAVTVSQDTDTPSDFKNSLKIAVTTNDSSVTSGDYYILQQKIEGQNIAQLNYGSSDAKTTTLSFFVKSSVTGTYSGSLRNQATDRSFVFQYTVSSANTWEQKSIAIVGDTSGTWLTSNDTGISLVFSLGQGTTYASSTVGSWHSGNYHGSTTEQDFISNASATFYITGIQLESGSQASDFQHEDIGTTLAKCDRYYQKSEGNNYTVFLVGGIDSSGGSAYVSRRLRVPMRAIPSFSFSNSYLYSVPSNTVTYTGSLDNRSDKDIVTIGFQQIDGDTADGHSIRFESSGDSGEVEFDAEL